MAERDIYLGGNCSATVDDDDNSNSNNKTTKKCLYIKDLSKSRVNSNNKTKTIVYTLCLNQRFPTWGVWSTSRPCSIMKILRETSGKELL